MSANVVKDFLFGLFFILIEVVIFQHLSFFGATPDPLLIYLLWLSIKYERFHLILLAASLGLVQDALFDYWGFNMFSKTLIFFAAYRFLNNFSENKLLVWQVAVIVFVIGFLHNCIFLGLSSFSNTFLTGYIPIIFLIGNSLYTSLLGAMLFIFKGN